MSEMITYEDLRGNGKKLLKPIYNIEQDFQIPVRTTDVRTETANIPFRNGTCRNPSKDQEFGRNIYSRNAWYNVV
jgi:hypothetical protein